MFGRYRKQEAPGSASRQAEPIARLRLPRLRTALRSDSQGDKSAAIQRRVSVFGQVNWLRDGTLTLGIARAASCYSGAVSNQTKQLSRRRHPLEGDPIIVMSK